MISRVEANAAHQLLDTHVALATDALCSGAEVEWSDGEQVKRRLGRAAGGVEVGGEASGGRVVQELLHTGVDCAIVGLVREKFVVASLHRRAN